MKAIVRETYGPPDVLHLEDVPLPAVRDGDVLVKVRAASANAGDWHLLRGTPLPFRIVAGLRTPKFKIIGHVSYVEERLARTPTAKPLDSRFTRVAYRYCLFRPGHTHVGTDSTGGRAFHAFTRRCAAANCKCAILLRKFSLSRDVGEHVGR